MNKRLQLSGGIAVVAAFVIAYLVGALPEAVAGVLLASAVILACCGIALTRFLQVLTAPLARLAAGILVVACGLAAMTAVVDSLVPGQSCSAGTLENPGDSIPLAGPAHGALRLLLHGVPAGGEAATVDVDLSLGAQGVTGHLSRTEERVRVGRRGRATVLREHDSDYLTVDVPADVNEIRVTDIRGRTAGPLRLEVFRELLPMRWKLSLSLVLLAAIALVASRAGADAVAVVAVAVALLFGLLVRQHATPDLAVRPEIGDLVIAVVAGSFGGGLLAWLLKKLIGPPSVVTGGPVE